MNGTPAHEQDVCILLPVYNGALYLAQQLESLLAQTHVHWHCLIRDDGSRDASRALIHQYCTRYPERFREITQVSGNLGIVGSLNVLSQYVDAPYFALCDQDDVWHADRLARTLAAVRGIEEAGARPALAYSDLELVDADLCPISPSFWRHTDIIDFVGDQRCLPVFNAFTGCTMLGNRALLRLAFPVPQAAPMHDYWIAMAAKYGGAATAVDAALICYRQHGRNQCGAAQALPLRQRLVARLRNVPGFVRQARQLRCMRLELLVELANRTQSVHTCAAYREALAAERGSPLARVSFLLRNRISPARAFVYWLA